MGLPPRNNSLVRNATSSVHDRPSLAFQRFHNFLGVFRFDPHLFERGAKVLEEQVEVRIVQTVNSGFGMCATNIFAGIHSSAE